MRLTRTEEARQPGAVRAVLVVVLEKSGQAICRFIRQNIFLKLSFQLRFVIRLDDAFNRTADILFENRIKCHRGCSFLDLSLKNVEGAVIAVTFQTTEERERCTRTGNLTIFTGKEEDKRDASDGRRQIVE